MSASPGLSVAVTVDSGEVQAVLARAGALAVDAAKVMGEAGRQLTFDHAARLDAQRSGRAFGVRTGFYQRAAESTTALRGSGADVSWAVTWRGFAQRFYGGRITPSQGKKYLTIPAAAASYGKRAGEFGKLKVLFGKNGPYGLADPQTGQKLYILKTEVNQDPDPSVLPTQAEFEKAAVDAGEFYLGRVFGGLA